MLMDVEKIVMRGPAGPTQFSYFRKTFCNEGLLLDFWILVGHGFSFVKAGPRNKIINYKI